MKQVTIGELSENVLAELRRLGYAASTTESYERLYHKLVRYAEANGIRDYSIEVAERWLAESFGIDLWHAVDGREGQYHNGYYRPIRVCQCLSEWYLHGSLALKRKGKLASCEVPAQFKAGYESYVQYCNDAEYSDRGIYTRLNRIKRILLFLDSRGITDFGRVTAAEVSAFFATQIELQSRTVATMLASIRVFFRHLYHNEFTANDLSQQLPKVKANREFKLPRIWRVEDVLTVLNSIDRGNPVGKRDYAILMLITRYGLRSADVKSLKLSSLRWTTNQIEIVQNKTGNPLRLPLLRDVGWAIIDYLQNGRPPCDHEEVFITSTVPIRPFGRHSAGLNAILAKRIRQAGVKIPASVPKGMHSLRHTLASVMLANPLFSQAWRNRGHRVYDQLIKSLTCRFVAEACNCA